MPIIDLNQLPAPDVVEELDFETILAERKAKLCVFFHSAKFFSLFHQKNLGAAGAPERYIFTTY